MNEHSFTVGSSLEVAENEQTIHPAIIMDKTHEGYLILGKMMQNKEQF